MTFLQKHYSGSSNGPSDPRTETLLNLDEAAAYVGVTAPVLGSLLKQYGVGRYHMNRSHDQIVYSMNDLARMKEAMRQVRSTESKTVAPPAEVPPPPAEKS